MGASVIGNWMSRRDVFAWLIDKIRIYDNQELLNNK